MKIKNAFLFLLGVIFLIIGFSYILNSTFGITGFITNGNTFPAEDSFIGVLFTLGGFFVLSRIRRKGQAAMEFLITYGWAILAAIIAIGVLALFYSPVQLSQHICVFTQPPFYCEGAEVAVDAIPDPGELSEVAFEITNNGGVAVTAIGAQFVSESGTTCSTGITSEGIPVGATRTGILICDGSFTEGDRINGDLSVFYTKPDSQLRQTSVGQISGRVREGISIINLPPGGSGGWTDPTEPGGGGGEEGGGGGTD